MPDRPASNPANPPIFHITHWKAGSQWVAGVLRRLATGRKVVNRINAMTLQETAIEPGVIYSPAYLMREHLFEVVPQPCTRFVVIRDLRDTLISWYFSVRYSHLANESVAARRRRVLEADQETGLLIVMEESLSAAAKVQRSWVGQDELILRYEDLIEDQIDGFSRICEHIGLDVGQERLRRVIANCSFERSSGRKPGEEDVHSHLRKGIAGDWRNHFTPRVTEAFKERYGQLLIDAGYERSLDWRGAV